MTIRNLIAMAAATAWLVSCAPTPPVEEEPVAKPADQGQTAPTDTGSTMEGQGVGDGSDVAAGDVTDDVAGDQTGQQGGDQAVAQDQTPVVLEPSHTIYFDFDRSEIRPGDRAILEANAEWLKANGNVTVILEGHCDERGTREYNLGLGQRRADSALKVLVALGVNASQIQTVSYGEDRPVDPGHNEDAWALNRRVELVIQ